MLGFVKGERWEDMICNFGFGKGRGGNVGSDCSENIDGSCSKKLGDDGNDGDGDRRPNNLNSLNKHALQNDDDNEVDHEEASEFCVEVE